MNKILKFLSSVIPNRAPIAQTPVTSSLMIAHVTNPLESRFTYHPQTNYHQNTTLKYLENATDTLNCDIDRVEDRLGYYQGNDVDMSQFMVDDQGLYDESLGESPETAALMTFMEQTNESGANISGGVPSAFMSSGMQDGYTDGLDYFTNMLEG